ncbi:hypothetical protein [Nonlabens tegetincola]|uniref:hypothetical protein n=1 Tax=Nonlabens tegetincola TaxID=323273 RepID=UPI001FD4569B|nr:hypothetical protein [Nonlabens tegetincola]
MLSCKNKDYNKEENPKKKELEQPTSAYVETVREIKFDSESKVIHSVVALCDNKYQGIAPVPSFLGNGQETKSNLYWGASYGLKTTFKKSLEWNLLRSEFIDSVILERLIFKHKTKNCYLIADAYNGRHIKKATEFLLGSASGKIKDTVVINNETIGIAGNSELITYQGHNGLMDFNLDKNYETLDGKNRDIIILACYSKNYFEPALKDCKVNNLIWTTGLMAPESYILDSAIKGYLNSESNDEITNRAAESYKKYQKCSFKTAKKLLVSN